MERLEPRHLLAAVSLIDGNLAVTGETTADALTIFANAANQRYEISDPGNLITTSIPGATGSGTNTVHVPFAAVTGDQLTVNTQGGNDTVVIGGEFPLGVTINTGDGADTVNFNLDVTLAADQSLAATAETINVGAGADIVTSGAGAIKFTADAMAINATATIVSAADVVIEKLSFTGGVTVGREDAGRLSLTDGELDRITAATTRLINPSESGFLVPNPITHANHLELLTPGPGGTEISAPITMAVDKNLTVSHLTLFGGNPHIRLISSNSDITTSGTGTISFLSQAAFDMVSGSSLTTENGGITIVARGASTSFTNYNLEIHGTVTSTGTGNISITGLSSTGQRGGVLIQGTVQSTSAANAPTQGRIRIEGINGTNNGAVLHGMHIAAAGLVTSDGGDIEIVGRGGTGPIPVGVLVRDTSGGIVARNNASISIDGTGGVGNAPLGFYFQRDVPASVSSVISSQNGSIVIRGTGGTSPTGADAQGVGLFTSAALATTTAMVSSAQGAITIEGTGGISPARDHGIVGASSGRTPYVSSNGAVTLRGVAGGAANSYAISTTIAGSFGLTAYQSGSLVEFYGDTFEFSRTSVASGQLAAAATGVVAFAPTTSGTPITLGGADVLTGSEKLGLSDAELDAIVAGTIRIGEATSGDIAVDGAIVPENDRSRHMQLVTGGNIVFNAALSTVGSFTTGAPTAGTLQLSPGPAGSVRPLVGSTDVTIRTGVTQFATTFAPGANLEINIAGTTVDAQYNQLTAVGAVDLTGADLVTTGAFVSSTGSVFTIVSANSVIGQFNGLPENKVFTHNGRSLRANYTATTVTLTDVGQPPTIDADALAVSVGEGSPATNTGTFNDPDGNATATVTASIGTVTQNNALGIWNWSLPTTNGPAGPFPVTVTVTDVWGATDEVTFEYAVTNVPAEVTSLVASVDAIAQGGTASFSGAFVDPGVETWQATATIQRSGFPDVLVPVTLNPDKTFSFNYQFSDAGMYSVTAAVDDGGPGTPVVKTVLVEVVAPPVLPGDYDMDGDVDGNDVLLWQRQLGDAASPYAGADGNGDRQVDGGDLSIWSGNFGMVEAMSTAAIAAEPSELHTSKLFGAEWLAMSPAKLDGGFDASHPRERRPPSGCDLGAAKSAFFAELGSTPPAPIDPQTRGLSRFSQASVDDDIVITIHDGQIDKNGSQLSPFAAEAANKSR